MEDWYYIFGTGKTILALSSSFTPEAVTPKDVLRLNVLDLPELSLCNLLPRSVVNS